MARPRNLVRDVCEYSFANLLQALRSAERRKRRERVVDGLVIDRTSGLTHEQPIGILQELRDLRHSEAAIRQQHSQAHGTRRIGHARSECIQVPGT